ncbi:hypothetical protein [Anatilimnocola floriformis]|uniref:hypothetical protein n=1 Tax=Anatilimnocola floriformis TaxID=2948575 RepID=UPI0020C3E4F8|nr:hypothetical protein [Anatilimnocola floriformis]
MLKDLENIKHNGSASLVELKQFLSRLQGRSPQEVVGLVSTSLLVQSMVIATLGSLAIMVAFTVGPYLMYGPPQVKQAKSGPGAKAAAPVAAAPSNAEETAKPADNEGRYKKALGVDETKTADPNKNPLDIDNLLDKK